MNTQLKKGALELCVLAQLARGDKYGYELTEAMSKEMAVAPGTLYLILKRLKDDAYVETYLVESETGPARKYYKMTPKGMTSYTKLKEEWEQFVKAVQNIIYQEDVL